VCQGIPEASGISFRISDKDRVKAMNIWRGIKRFFVNLWNLLRETRAELKKVVWPTWAQVRVYTAVVLFSMITVGVILWGTDAILSIGIGAILRR